MHRGDGLAVEEPEEILPAVSVHRLQPGGQLHTRSAAGGEQEAFDALEEHVDFAQLASQRR